MAGRLRIAIGTRTTPRKRSAIRRALSGQLDKFSLGYIQTKYQYALYRSLRNMLPVSMPNQDVRAFIQDCLNDAFTRIKEYNPRYRFRSFLVYKIILPALKTFSRTRQKEKVILEECLESEQRYSKPLEDELQKNLSQEFVKDALLQLKQEDEIKYEVLYRRNHNNLSYKEIYNELKREYPSRIKSEAAARVTYQRAEQKLKRLFRKLIKQGRYVDKDLSFSKGLIKSLRAETTRK